MHSTMNPKPTDDPHDVLVVAPDVALMVPTDEELSQLAHSLRHPNPQARMGPDFSAGPAIPPVDTTFRPAVTGGVQVPGRGRTARAITASLLLATCTGAAAVAWQAYGGAGWAPQLAQTTLPATEATAANPAPPQPGSLAQNAPEGVAPAAAPSLESAPLLGSMRNDIASARQEIDQLKASIEELKANQQQMSRDIATASEAKPSEARTSEVKASQQNLRPKIAAHPGPATAPRARKPVPPMPPQQAAAYPTLPQPAAPYVPRQVEPQPQSMGEPLTDPELAAVPRPPMPLR